MRATLRSSGTFFSVLAFGFFFSAVAVYPQSTDIPTALPRSNSRSSANLLLGKCAEPTIGAFPLAHLAKMGDAPSFPIEMADYTRLTILTDSGCPKTPGVPQRSADVPCRSDTAALRLVVHFPCGEPADPVPGQLASLGKDGLKIMRARDAVLDILRSDNACSEWFETKEAKPATIFQSLRFEIDRKGQTEVFESRPTPATEIFHHPYVARATQDGGAYTPIVINAGGAFYRPQGMVAWFAAEGGPKKSDGVHGLTVGPYSGDTAEAEIVTLLHELGHVINLLPMDSDDLDGSSARNTNEVLRHCKAEVETHAREERQAAKLKL
jgi:hypothetical protein